MENSKFNDSGDIEEIKLRINAYRTFLTTLKSGVSIEDYLNIRNEFYNLKTRITEIVYAGDAMEEGHSSNIKTNNKQIQQFTPQLTSLTQTVEEFLIVLNQLIEETAQKKSMEEPPPALKTTVEEIGRDVDERLSTDKQGPKVPQPTYRQLKNLADRKSQLKLVDESLARKKEDNTIVTHSSHFNADYFQATNSTISNSTSKMDAKAADYFKNRHKRNNTEVQKSTNELTVSMPSSIYGDIPLNTNTTQHIQESHSMDDQTIEQQPQTTSPLIEEEASALETKKPKNSSFFNFFRK